MLYNVKIKPVKSIFWKTIKNIENDWILKDYVPHIPKRTVVDKDKNSYEINMSDTIIIFSKERVVGDIKGSRIKFDVKYKKPHSLFWHTIKNCIVDSVLYETTNSPIRVFITDTNERWEIPCKHYVFKFDKNKLLAIQDVMEQEAGQPINAIK